MGTDVHFSNWMLVLPVIIRAWTISFIFGVKTMAEGESATFRVKTEKVEIEIKSSQSRITQIVDKYEDEIDALIESQVQAYAGRYYEPED